MLPIYLVMHRFRYCFESRSYFSAVIVVGVADDGERKF